MFKKATKTTQKLRLLLEGASGSGKTYSALVLAKSLGKKIAVIDTEKGSASLYANMFGFDTCELSPPFTPESYINAIKAAENMGYDVIIIDSTTHEWSGQGGCLDIHTQLGGQFQNWKQVTPRHNKFIDAILQSNCHIISTARTKTEYNITQGTNSQGKTVNKPEKVGMKTEQRDGMDYEYTIVFRLNENHMASATKDRTSLFTGIDEVITEKTGEKILNWLNDGSPVQEKPSRPPFSETHSPAVGSIADETTEEIMQELQNTNLDRPLNQAEKDHVKEIFKEKGGGFADFMNNKPTYGKYLELIIEKAV